MKYEGMAKATKTIMKMMKIWKASLRTLMMHTTTGPRDLLRRNQRSGVRKARLPPMAKNVAPMLTEWFPDRFALMSFSTV